MKDLIILVADLDIERCVHGLLSRRQSLNISPINYEIYPHPQHDPGCYRKAHTFLAPYAADFRFSLVVFDRDGCGASPDADRTTLEAEVEARVASRGWESRTATVTIDPELEVWVWSDSPRVDSVLGWSNRQPPLRSWLVQRGFLSVDAAKPADPKAATLAALREVGRGRSATIFEQLASQVGLSRCSDPAFAKITETLRAWFPVQGATT